MAFTEQDEKQIAAWFEEKQRHPKDSDEYYRYRDLIFTDTLKKLSDYFSALKNTWSLKYHIPEEDGISIVHDGLLAASNTYDPSFKDKQQKSPKFLTYLTHIMNNLAYNYFNRDHITETRKKRKIRKIPKSAYTSLDTLLIIIDGIDDRESFSPIFHDLLNYLVERSQVFEEQLENRDFIERFSAKLSDSNKALIQYLLDGFTFREIAEKFNLSTPGVRQRFRKIVQAIQVDA